MLSGPVGVLRTLLLTAAGLGLGYLPFDVADQHRAQQLEQHGRTVSVTDVRVHVSYVYAKAGGWHEVDEVQVHLPALGDQRWVDVTGLPNLELDEQQQGKTWRNGWQSPTAGTSYRPPMTVVYRVGRNVDAMTPGDIARWSDSDDVTVSAVLAGVGTLGFGATVGRRAKRLMRRRRDAPAAAPSA